MKQANKKVMLKGKEVAYTLRRSSRAKRVRIRVAHEGAVTVTAPIYLPEFLVNTMLQQKSRWLLKYINFFQERHSKLQLRHDDYEKQKHAARSLIIARINHFNQFYGFAFSRISIRNQKTRWGSCSSKGNLNFNYQLLYLPATLRDYVIVHELCHLKELNHSAKFWALVAHTVPDYKTHRRSLKNKVI